MILPISQDTQLSFETSGDTNAPALVLLHAFPLSSTMWQVQREFFAAHFRVITPDARGVGTSTPFNSEPSFIQSAQDVAALLDALDIQSAIVGGCSMGGYTALEFARQFPQRLRGLILCDTRADADSKEARQGRDEMMAFARQHDGLAVAEKMMPKLLSDESREHKPALVQKVRDWATSLSGERAAELVQALRDRRDSTPILPSIQVPTLVIGGRSDVPSPPQVMAQMAAMVPGAQHFIVEGAGHLPSVEQPDIWNSAVQLWLKANGL